MKWNYRVVEIKTDSPIFERHRVLCEVYYDNQGIPSGFVEAVISWNPDEGQSGLDLLEQVKEAFNKPVLVEADFIGDLA